MLPETSRALRRGLVAGLGTALAVTAVLGTPAGAAPASSTTDPTSDAAKVTGVDSAEAVVQLSLEPLATSPRTRPAKGKKIDFSSATVKSERARLSAQRNDFKKWLASAAPKAKVAGEYDVAVNAVAVTLNGTSLDLLRGGPGVVGASYQAFYSALDANDPDLGLVNALQAWGSPQVGGGANAGAGVKVGIIDTGIDITHPCFDARGIGYTYPKYTGNVGDPSLTNAKVVVAKVFYNKAKNQGLTAAAIGDHGSHVAGTVACELDTPASVDGVSIPYAVSGVAPAAQLGNYNIFPNDIENARSEDILDALQAAAEDGMDVLNMSLGGGAHGIQDLLTTAVDNLDRANIVVAVANGNSGPGHFTVESPGSAERALSAGAASVGQFLGLPLTVGGSTFATATGDFPVPTGSLTALLKPVLTPAGTLSTACSTAPPAAGSLTGSIALVSRGACAFSEKIRNAQSAGAVAVVVVNNVGGDPVAMASDGTPNQPTVPAVMASGAADVKAALVAASGQSATLASTLSYLRTPNDDVMAGFSSQGPTDVDFRVKPDVVAPGVNVLSSIPRSFCGGQACWAFFQGTSMATPHLAGIAAVLRGADPGWTAEQVRSAIVNTATQGTLRNSDATTPATDVNLVGAGRADTLSALGATVAVGPVSTSFGAVPSGSGQVLTKQVTLTNLTAAPVTLSLSVDGSGVFSVGRRR